MKLKLGSTLIVGFGGLLSIGLSYWQGSNWYAFAFAPFALWALLYAHEEINIDSWHYQLASKYFKENLKGVCKACPYWGLVALSVFFVFVQIVYGVVLQLVAYLWHTVWLLFGFRPKWRMIAYRWLHGTGVQYLYKRRPRKGDEQWSEMIITVVRPIFTFGTTLALVLLLGLHVITLPFHAFYHGQPAYFTAPATYFGVLAVAALMELWLATGWSAIKWAYGKSCPDAKFVQKAPATAKPTNTPTTDTY